MNNPRNIQKSIRISQELYREVEKFEGNTWNDKINNMLNFYTLQHKEYLQHLKNLELQIEERQKFLEEFKTRFQELLN